MEQPEAVAQVIGYYAGFLFIPVVAGLMFALVAWLFSKNRSPKNIVTWFFVGFILILIFVFLGAR